MAYSRHQLKDKVNLVRKNPQPKPSPELRIIHDVFLLFVNVYNRVFAAAEADGFSVFDSVDTVLLVDAVKQVGGVVGGRHFLIVDDIHAGLV